MGTDVITPNLFLPINGKNKRQKSKNNINLTATLSKAKKCSINDIIDLKNNLIEKAAGASTLAFISIAVTAASAVIGVSETIFAGLFTGSFALVGLSLGLSAIATGMDFFNLNKTIRV